MSFALHPIRNWYEGLDGVRGIAVFLVFSVHYMGRQTLYTGWIGVMIFFVLSGFLITGILYDNRDTRHRFRNFFWRRALRIFPLFYFIWLVVLVLCLAGKLNWRPILWLWPACLGNFARFIAGSSSVDHIPTVWGTSRFEMGHFWSLAVEEQFYLFWPLVVFLVRRREILVRICLSTIVLVPILRSVAFHTLPVGWLNLELLYRMTFSHADAFLMGGLAALILRGPARERLQAAGRILLPVSLLLIFVFWWMYRPWGVHTLAPWVQQYGFSLIDTASLGLILCALEQGSWIYRITTWKPLSLLGRYSYGFYVYHVPLQPLLRSLLPAVVAVPGHKMSFAALLIAEFWVSFLIVLAISAMSFHWLEKPFLRFKDHFQMRHVNPELAIHLRTL